MLYCKISQDLNLSAMNLYKCELVSLDDILDCVGFSEWTFYHVVRLWRETGVESLAMSSNIQMDFMVVPASLYSMIFNICWGMLRKGQQLLLYVE